MRYYVTAPPDITLLESDNLEECGKVAAFNAKLSGNVILVVEDATDEVVGVGLPPGIPAFCMEDPTIHKGMTPREVAKILRGK